VARRLSSQWNVRDTRENVPKVATYRHESDCRANGLNGQGVFFRSISVSHTRTVSSRRVALFPFRAFRVRFPCRRRNTLARATEGPREEALMNGLATAREFNLDSRKHTAKLIRPISSVIGKFARGSHHAIPAATSQSPANVMASASRSVWRTLAKFAESV